jgi:protoporphyrinogen IX oxidase
VLWFLVLHISALLFWCAALLYLPALIVGTARKQTDIVESPYQQDSVARFVFTHVATPAALLAIIFGTVVFVWETIVDAWLIAKLTLVAGLVLAHALSGILVLRLERNTGEPLRGWCWLLAVVLCVLMVAIVWIVLAKPPEEVLPWMG